MEVRHWIAAAVAAGAFAFVSTAAFADPVQCGSTIAKESAKYRKTVVKTRVKCELGVIGKCTPASLASCPDATGAAKITDAASAMKSKIAAACGGANDTCEAAPGDGDDSLAAIRWDTGTCVGFEGQCTGIAIDDCADIGDCLECIANAQSDQAIDGLLFDRFNTAPFCPNNQSEPQKTESKCQVGIAKSAAKFLTAKEKILGKCWDAKLSGVTGFDDSVQCPDTDPNPGSGLPPALPGDNKTVEAIKKAEQKKINAICKACGADGDGDKNGVCENPAGALLIGSVAPSFPCPNVLVPPNAVHPAGLDCSAVDDLGATTNIDDLQEYIECIDCVLDNGADCATASSVGDDEPSMGIDYQCAECVVASTCPGSDTECQARTCDSGVCGFAYAAAGTPTSTQSPGDCHQNECDGSGNVVNAVNDADVLDDSIQCTTDTCTSGVPSNPPAMAGSPCSEGGGTECDGVGQCVCGEPLTAVLLPGGGPQLPPTLYLDASLSGGACGAPIDYFWGCQGTNSANCNAFVAAVSGGDVVTYEFPLAPGEIYNIGLQVCLQGNGFCSTLVTNGYDGSSFE